MKLKIILITFIFLFLNFFIHTSELRLKAMAGISNLGLYVVPDIWCDSFFVNPAYAPENKNNLINIFSNAYLSFYDSDKVFKSDITDYHNSNIGLNLRTNSDFGMIIPLKKFSLGFNLKFHTDYNKYKDLIDGDLYEANRFDLYSDLLFSWKINKFVNLGFILGVNTLLYNNDKSIHDGAVYDPIEKTIFDIDCSNNFGIHFKRNKLNFSLSFPISFRYYQWYPYEAYDEAVNDWEYRKDVFFGSSKIKAVSDINVSKKTRYYKD